MLSRLKKIFTSKRKWPGEIPKLYSVEGDQLYHFMDDDTANKISEFPIIRIYPPFITEDEDDFHCLAIGLSRVLIRNLMLVPDLSVVGPEDSSLIPYDHFHEEYTTERGNIFDVTGRFFYEDNFAADCVVIGAEERFSLEVEGDDLSTFIMNYCQSLATVFGGTIDNKVKEQWKSGQPETIEQLYFLGVAVINDRQNIYEESEDFDAQIIEHFKDYSGFVLPLHYLSDNADKLPLFLKGMEADPFDAQLGFLTFCEIWDSEEIQPEAFQFLRRAIELSPGHGKSHMCVPHSIPWDNTLLKHSYLGYHLLPGNNFAVNNYINNLNMANVNPSDIVDIAISGIENDSNDPSNYDRLIELYIELEKYDKALEIASLLKDLYAPPINERTLYCIKQNPHMKKAFEAGEYDPLAEIENTIFLLKRKISWRI